MSRPNQVEISASALAHNLAVARRAAPHARVMGAIKANAYGHGAALVATLLAEAGIEAFALASIEEAEELHRGISGSTLATVEHSGHMIPLEQPKALARVMTEWLASLS